MSSGGRMASVSQNSAQSKKAYVLNKDHFSRSHTDTSSAGRSLHLDTIVLNTHTLIRGSARRAATRPFVQVGAIRSLTPP